MKWIYPILGNRSFLWLLLIINVFGTIYGYVWYKWQLVETPTIFLPFVPDSPTASLFFCFCTSGLFIREELGVDGGACGCHLI